MIRGIDGSSRSSFGLNEEEQQERRAQLFKEVDKSGDGIIDKAEFSALAEALAKRGAVAIDAEEVFSGFDADQDGVLNQDELGDFVAANAPPRPPAGIAPPPQRPPELEDLFKEFDSDKDGLIDESEFASLLARLEEKPSGTAANKDRFAVYDADGDGGLSMEEVGLFLMVTRPDSPAPPGHSEMPSESPSVDLSA